MADEGTTAAEATEQPVDGAATGETGDAGSGADTGLVGGGGGSETASAPATWPEGWRGLMAGDDEKAAKRLDRFDSPAAIFESYRNLEKKLSEKSAGAPLPDDPTDEQLASWREANGIPSDPAGYLDKLPDGLVLGEEDRPFAEDFAAKMHEMNARPEVVAQALAWDRQRAETIAAQQAEADQKQQAAAEDALRGEWGAEFRANVNSVRNFIDATAPARPEGEQSFFDLIFSGRAGDGTKLGDHPDVLRWLSRLSRELNPAGVVAPAGGGSQIESVKDEIKEIEEVMRSDRARYNRDEGMQKRYRELLEAEETLAKRAA